jgi:hypothetical protein
MICKEFIRHLDALEGSNFPTAMREHLLSCPECRKRAEMQQLGENGLTALGRATPVIDVSARIMNRIRQEGAGSDAATLPAAASAPASPWFWQAAAVFAIGTALAIGFGAGRTALNQPPQAPLVHPDQHAQPELQKPQASGWSMTITTGEAEPGHGHGQPVELIVGETTRLGTTEKAVVEYSNTIEVLIQDGSFLSYPGGLVLFSGKTWIKTTPDAPPLTIGAPFGELLLTGGSQGLLEVSDDGLQLSMKSGLGKVSYLAKTREVRADQKIFLGKDGFADQNASDSVHLEYPVDSSIEKGNPGD